MHPPDVPSESLSGPHRPGIRLAFAVSAASALLTGFGVFTQRFAHAFGHHEKLGPPWIAAGAVPAALAAFGTVVAGALLVLGLGHRRSRPVALALVPVAGFFLALLLGPLYTPQQGAVWLVRMLRQAETRPVLAGPARDGAATAGALLAASLLTAAARPRDPKTIAHGSARFATPRDLAAAGLADRGEGIVLGATGRSRPSRPLVDRSDQHALLILPPGGGKTSGPIVGTLLSTPSANAFVVDPKGELWRLTAGYRHAAGHRCLRFAPHELATGLAWNCLAEVPRGPREVKALAAIAENLVTYPAAAGDDSHWIASARNLFRALALHALYTDPQASMPAVRQLLNDPAGPRGFNGLCDQMMHAAHDPEGACGFRDPTSGQPTPTHPEVARLARSLRDTPPRERGSIVSTLNQFLSVWGDERVAAHSRGPGFSLADLVGGGRPTSLYVTLPFDELTRLAPLVRVLLALLTLRVTAPEGEPSTRRPLLLVLDEFAALGRVPILEEMLAFLRGYGVRALLAVQDLNQLRRLYSDRESISGTCPIHVLGATQNTATREHASRLAGEATVLYQRRSLSGGRHTPLKPRATINDAETRRPLLTEGEIGTLPPDRLLVLKTGLPPILAWKLPYWTDLALAARAAIAPPGVAAVADPEPPRATVRVGEGLVIPPCEPEDARRPRRAERELGGDRDH